MNDFRSLLLFWLLPVIYPVVTDAQHYGFSGRWKEVRRTDRTGMVLSFSDTNRLNFPGGLQYTWAQRGGFLYSGNYRTADGRLYIGKSSFRIVSQSSEGLILNDDNTTYQFSPEVFPKKYRVSVINPDRFAGKWTVYKRSGTRPMQPADYDMLLRSVTIFPEPDTNGRLGWIIAGRDPDNHPSAYIVRLKNDKLYVMGKWNRVFEVLKADSELILREDDLTYFFKKFRQEGISGTTKPTTGWNR